jgi:hypothetical protein
MKKLAHETDPSSMGCFMLLLKSTKTRNSMGCFMLFLLDSQLYGMLLAVSENLDLQLDETFHGVSEKLRLKIGWNVSCRFLNTSTEKTLTTPNSTECFVLFMNKTLTLRGGATSKCLRAYFSSFRTFFPLETSTSISCH